MCSSMLLHLYLAVLGNVDSSAAWLVCTHGGILGSISVCCSVLRSDMENYVQQHVASPVFSCVMQY